MNARVRVSDYMSHKDSVNDTLRCQFANIVAYPQNNVRDVAKIMKDVKVDCLPVLSSPWNKKLVGFIKLSNIQVVLNEQF